MPAAPTLHTIGLDVLVAANVRLVYFNHATAHAERNEVSFAHRFSDPVRHEPSRLESNPKRAVKLVRGNAFLAAGNEEDRLQPHTQGYVAGVKDRVHRYPERLAAGTALVDTDP